MGRAGLGLGTPGGQCSEDARGRSSLWAVFGHTGQHRTYEGSVPVPDTQLGPSTVSEAAELGPSRAADVCHLRSFRDTWPH